MVLALGALGVVYGDIGTSPLYAVKQCFEGVHAVPVSTANILGLLSLIVWSLVLVISLKYLSFVMRADNRGEGGILSLMSLIRPDRPGRKKSRWILVSMGLFGAALLYGDGIITPAISVLSAIEGLHVATPFFDPYIIPITIVILISLFLLQRQGSARVGAVFGPVMILWFLTIAVLGLIHLREQPHVLAAVNPLYAFRFFEVNRWKGFLTLGVVFLVVTGGEALYADMGHFGARPIRMVWFALVLPSLLLNYFGQCALILTDPSAAENPFFRMAPSWALYPLIILSTAATVIASQAVISGAFSLTRQAVQLGYSPRLEIDHTSKSQIGQIYIPAVNWTLMIACIGLVIGFGSSGALAAAYGVAVTTTMVITTLILYIVERELWHWSRAGALALSGFFLVFDLAFFSANIIKVQDGGWFPLVVAAFVFTLMTTWRKGRTVLNMRLEESSLSTDLFLHSVASTPPLRVPGTAIYMHRSRGVTPTALLHNLKHNHVLHDRVILLTILTEEIPEVPALEKMELENIGHGIHRLILHYGFMEDPDIPEFLSTVMVEGQPFAPMKTTYFLGRETLVPSRRKGMVIWRERLFAWMSRNASGAARFFHLPPNRVVELGAQIEL
ncbi:MAG: potassium transporter Kup [Acidobacteriota bacterium]